MLRATKQVNNVQNLGGSSGVSAQIPSGLDNNAADGAAGFQTLEMLIEALEKGGMKKQWCVDDDFDRAKADILQWKAHIIRSVNEEQAKQDSMKSVDATSAVIIMGLGHEVSSNEIS